MSAPINFNISKKSRFVKAREDEAEAKKIAEVEAEKKRVLELQV